jgi:O-acetyl-ADP-ribose deacetylase (regulator of RNase III)
MPLNFIRDDITRVEAGAIVNAANNYLQQGSGVCGAIFAKAGAREMQQACDAIGYCATGSAVMTPGFGLPAKYVIHTVGPVWQGGTKGEEAALRGAYRASLKLAQEAQLESIAFPLISAGIYGYPWEEAVAIAMNEIERFLLEHEMLVYLVFFDRKSPVLSQKLHLELQAFIDNHCQSSKLIKQPRSQNDSERIRAQQIKNTVAPLPVCETEESFSQTLLRLIDASGLSDAEVYKRANMDRKHFIKIRSNPNYAPSKGTLLALSIALGLDIQDAVLLLEQAGFAFNPAFKRDVIVRWFLERGKPNIHEVNAALFDYDQKLLGL